ncbi:caspase family protein [Herbaspirillum sp. NPDC101397]|uniref:caspase family protein n=1 Tax=Herbaspirillum sp. NPDC101397 TaxID=3364006 RepID=UPI00383B05D2
MFKNLAIILGVTNYQSPNRPLPACTNDVALIEALARRGGEFQDVVVLQSRDAEAVKMELAEVIRRYEYDDIGHLFFYFTGHGEEVNGEFCYLLRNYDKSCAAQTSISNSDLDQMLLSLSPVLFVKVVDACYSGVAYIKDGSSRFDSYKDFIKGKHPKIYFMASSEGDQRSYADVRGSDFTNAFARGVVSQSSELVRYKAIADFVTDAFENKGGQVPYFIVQGNQTETFGTYAADVKELIKDMLPPADQLGDVNIAVIENEDCEMDEPVESASTNARTTNLVELVRQRAALYATMAEAQQYIDQLHTLLGTPLVDPTVEQLFEVSVDFSASYDGLYGKEIAQWLLQNQDRNYFASPTHTTEEFETTVNPLFGGLAAFTGEEPKKVVKTRRVLSGVSSPLSKDMSFSVCWIGLKPKFQNLTKFGADFTYLVSKTHIQIFYRFKKYVEKAWGDFSVDRYSDWQRTEHATRDSGQATNVVSEFYTSLYAWVLEDVGHTFTDDRKISEES